MRNIGYVFTLIEKERQRQESLKASCRFKYTLRDYDISESNKISVIMEEIGEVARNVLARNMLVTDGDTDDDSLIRELVQVASLSVAWLERLIEDQEMEITDAQDFRHR